MTAPPVDTDDRPSILARKITPSLAEPPKQENGSGAGVPEPLPKPAKGGDTAGPCLSYWLNLSFRRQDYIFLSFFIMPLLFIIPWFMSLPIPFFIVFVFVM